MLKALLIPMAASRYLYAGFSELRLSSIVCEKGGRSFVT